MEATAEVEAELEVIEAVSNNEVTIAAIEAEKEVAIAEIHANARVDEAALYSTNTNTDTEIWTVLNLLTSQQAETQAMLAQLLATQAQEAPLSSLEVEAQEAEMLTAQELSSTQSNTLLETNSMGTEPIEKSEVESPAIIPPLIEVGGKPIIRLI